MTVVSFIFGKNKRSYLIPTECNREALRAATKEDAVLRTEEDDLIAVRTRLVALPA